MLDYHSLKHRLYSHTTYELVGFSSANKDTMSFLSSPTNVTHTVPTMYEVPVVIVDKVYMGVVPDV